MGDVGRWGNHFCKQHWWWLWKQRLKHVAWKWKFLRSTNEDESRWDFVTGIIVINDDFILFNTITHCYPVISSKKYFYEGVISKGLIWCNQHLPTSLQVGIKKWMVGKCWYSLVDRQRLWTAEQKVRKSAQCWAPGSVVARRGSGGEGRCWVGAMRAASV